MRSGMYWTSSVLFLSGLGYYALGNNGLAITCTVLGAMFWLVLLGETNHKKSNGI